MRSYILDIFRGIAALWVFSFHYSFSQSFQDHLPALYTLARYGHEGVPMFFVMSGYCIGASASSARRRGESVRSFIQRRLIRIYPPFWCSIIVVVALPFGIEGLSSLKTGNFQWPTAESGWLFLDYSPSDWLSLISLLNIFSWEAPVLGLQQQFSAINAVYWTLAIEVQFYLAVAAALLFRRYYVIALTVVTAWSLLVVFVRPMPPSGLFLPYWPMFVLGMILFWLMRQSFLDRLSYRRLTQAAACLTALIGLILATNEMYRNLSFSLFFAAILFLMLPLDQLIEKSLPNWPKIAKSLLRLGLTVGAMSYSLYLLHGKLYLLAAQGVRQIVQENCIAFDLLVFFCTCVACYGFYLLCERPFLLASQRKKQRLLHATPPVAA